MSIRRKIDLNQREIVQGLRALGYTVRPTHTIGRGFPDLAIGKAGLTLLVEVKRPGEKLTADEIEFFETWRGAAIIGISVEQIHSEFEKKIHSEFEKGIIP